MAEFYRSRLEKKQDDDISRKTVLLGIVTVVSLILVMVFGLPFLVRFSILLGDAKNRGTKERTEKVLPPLPPRLIVPYEATNSARINISGLAEPKTKAELLKDDISIAKADVNDSGEFVFEDIYLEKGNNVFVALVNTDKGGNSEMSKSTKIVFDNEAPEISMINPVEDKIKVDTADFDVIGKSEKGVSVTINNRLAMVDDEGKFKLKLQLNSGKNGVEIIVTDQAGNQTRKNIEITYDF